MAKVSLSEVAIETARVYVNEEDFFEVRGLALADLINLTKQHLSEMERVFVDFMEQRSDGKTVTVDFIKGLATSALTECPKLVYAAIALASDDPEAEPEVIGKLRVSVQIDAMLNVAALTIKSETELKKLGEALTKGTEWVTRFVRENQIEVPALSVNGLFKSGAARAR